MDAGDGAEHGALMELLPTFEGSFGCGVGAARARPQKAPLLVPFARLGLTLRARFGTSNEKGRRQQWALVFE
jgi:hypothetical protein